MREREARRWISYIVTILCAFGAAKTKQYGFAFLLVAYATQQHNRPTTPEAPDA